MRYATPLLLLLLAGLAGRPAAAQDRDLLVSVQHVIVPQTRSFRLVRTEQPIRIESVKARVRILEQAASTTLDVSILNPGPRRQEAVLLLPVPDGAVVHAFEFEGAASEPTARLLPKDEARRLYDSIVARVRDPALLEFAGYNVVRSSVFPVPAGGRQRVRLSYNHLLDSDGNRVDYLLPRSEALEVDVPWEVSADIQAKSPIATVYSPSHELIVQRHDERHVAITAKTTGRLEPGPFHISYLLQRDGLSASLFAYPDPKIGGGYFLLLAGMPRHAADQVRRIRREVTLVIDRSGSMAGGNLDQVKKAALQITEGLEDGEVFNIIDYSSAVALFAPKPVPRSGATVARARAYLETLRPTGGTNIHDALVEALRQEPTPGTLPLVLFLTDGLPTIGRTSEVTIREAVEKGNPHQRRVFTLGVGHDVNVPLLDRVAEVSRATATYVSPGEDVELKVAAVFRRLYGPVLAGGRLETLDAEGNLTTQAVRELIPAVLPDLFDGDQLVLLGQYRGGRPIVFKIAGNYLGTPREFRFQFDLERAATTRNAFVPRLWASRRIAFLVDQIRQAGAAAGGRPALEGETLFDDPRFRELADEILRLSTEFGILSEYTAFLATEGTRLEDWHRLVAYAAVEFDNRAVRTRSGQAAVAQGLNVDFAKKQKRLNPMNEFLDGKLERVEVSGVQQSADRGLFQRGRQWIDGRIVAANIALRPDRVVRYGTHEFEVLLDQLVREGRQALIARKGDILIRLNDENVQVQYHFQGE